MRKNTIFSIKSQKKHRITSAMAQITRWFDFLIFHFFIFCPGVAEYFIKSFHVFRLSEGFTVPWPFDSISFTISDNAGNPRSFVKLVPQPNVALTFPLQ